MLLILVVFANIYQYSTAVALDFFFVISCLLLVAIGSGKKGTLIFCLFLQACMLAVILPVASGFREIVIYEQLSNIPKTADLDPKVLDWISKPSIYFPEKLFHGRILFPWIPDTRPEFPIRYNDCYIIAAILLFLIQLYYYCKKDEPLIENDKTR